MSNQDVEAQKADTSPAAAAKTPSGTAARAHVGKKAAAISALLVAVPALIVGSIALSRANAAATSQSQPQLNLDVSTAHHGGEADGTTTSTNKSKTSGDEVESKGDAGTLDAVSSAAILKCGVIPVVGFADNSTGTWVGMDADLCRAVAAGVGAEVEFVQTTFPDRWIDLQSGRFDLLSAYTTHTMERDVSQASVGKGFCFSEPYFYDGATCKCATLKAASTF